MAVPADAVVQAQQGGRQRRAASLGPAELARREWCSSRRMPVAVAHVFMNWTPGSVETTGNPPRVESVVGEQRHRV